MEYNVEYNVLQEEITTTNHHLEMLKQEKSKNQHLEQQLQVSAQISWEHKRNTSQGMIYGFRRIYIYIF